MKILVTGGAGMIGSHAAMHWAHQGHQVTVLDNLARSRLFGVDRDSVEHTWHLLGQQAGIRLVLGDVRLAADIEEALADGVDVVLHAAGQPGVGFSLRQPAEDFSINAFGTLQVLERVRQQSPQAAVLFCSTNKVYGGNVNALALRETPRRYALADGEAGVRESMPLDLTGHTPYGVSKLAADLYVQEYAHAFGIRTGVFRMSCIYGTRQFGFEDQGWVAHFAISTILGRPITIYGDGKQVRDVLFIDDLVRAFDAFLASAVPHAVLNLGGGPAHTTSLLELLDLLEAQTGKRSPVTYAGWRPSDQKAYVSDITRARTMLGWEPQVPFVKGLTQMIAWVEHHRDLLDEPSGPMAVSEPVPRALSA